MTVPQPLIPGQMPQAGLPIHSDPSTVHANSRHHTAPDQGSIAGLGQDLAPALPLQGSLLEERTPPLQSPPNVQPPTEDSSSVSNPQKIPSSISWTGQIPSSSSAHQETQSSTQAQQLLYDSASTFATSSIPADRSKSNPARASDPLNPTSIPSSSPSLLPAQNSSQILADLSSASNPLKQTNGSIPAKPASAESSAAIIQSDSGQGPVSKMCATVEGNLTCINLYRIAPRVACPRLIPSHLQVLKCHRHLCYQAHQPIRPSLNQRQLPKGGEWLPLNHARLQLRELHSILILLPPLGLCKWWAPTRKRKKEASEGGLKANLKIL
jgi:hypothetical protein